MAITSYSTLKTSVSDWLDRDDIADAVDTFIDMAEADLYGRLRVRQMEASFSDTIASGSVDIPSDWLEAKALYINGDPVVALEFKPLDWINQHYPTRSSSGKPVFVAQEGATLVFGPYPDSTYSVLGTYYARPTALSTSNETNWLITSHPDVLLYGALIHSAPYLGHDPRVDLWVQGYERAIERIKSEDRRSKQPFSVPIRQSVA